MKPDTNYPSDYFRTVKDEFSENLREQMRSTDNTISSLSKISGISRSVISGYLSDDASLPNVLNLVRLANALECPAGTLLPPPVIATGAQSIIDEVELIPARSFDARWSSTLQTIASAYNQFIYYVPNTVPDPLKTSDILCWEHQDNFGENMSQYIESTREMANLPLNGAVLIDEAVVTDLLEQRGVYKTLPREIAEAQWNKIIAFSKQRFPQWNIIVVNRLSAQISPCFLLSNTMILQEFFDYIVLIRNQGAIQQVQAKLNNALRSGVDILQWQDA